MAIVVSIVSKQVEGLHKASGLVKVSDLFYQMKIARDTPSYKNHNVKILNNRQNLF